MDGALLAAMRDTMRHRGPDGAGLWISDDRRAGLGHRRLAIVDLSPGGQQPMADATGRFHITFNGEIYNHRELRRELEEKGHRFRSSSDTEVLIASYLEWGARCVERLNGMFAFGIFDSAAQRLFLARDRAGEKPLFYTHAPGGFVFASELKALMAWPEFDRRLDPDAMSCYLAYGYVLGPRSILRAARKLPPGCTLAYDLESDAVEISRYWSLPAGAASPGADAQELAGELERLLQDAVRRQLSADVPVGILLSGGVDSSVVTALAARASSAPLRTFTITFPGRKSCDEGPYARMVAHYFGTRHTELAAEETGLELLPELARQYDEPLADSSMLPTFLVSRLVRRSVKVALGGDGGDELFGGYPHYNLLRYAALARRLLPGWTRSWLADAAASRSPCGRRGRNYVLSLGQDSARALAQTQVFLDPAARTSVLNAELLRHCGQLPEAVKADLAPPRSSWLRGATTLDFLAYLPEDILVKVDRASMLNSLEVRAPLLDYRVIDFAFRLPDGLRATASRRKVLLRRLAARLLPPRFDLTRKQGFSVPIAAWFRGSWGAYAEEILAEADAGIFRRPGLRRLLAHRHESFFNPKHLFAIMFFELWRREYRVSV